MKFEKFEDIIAWQKARELTREVYAHNLPNDPEKVLKKRELVN